MNLLAGRAAYGEHLQPHQDLGLESKSIFLPLGIWDPWKEAEVGWMGSVVWVLLASLLCPGPCSLAQQPEGQV